MKRSKAFILVEILTGMALQAGFIIVLCTSFYLMLSFYTRTQQVLNARQKGGKVIAYVESRIKNAGLGLHKCSSSSEIRNALSQINFAKNTPSPALPVCITFGDGSKTGDKWSAILENEDKTKFRGNILTLLYTERPSDLNMTIKTSEDLSADVKGGNIPLSIDTTPIGLVSPKTEDGKLIFQESEFTSGSTSNKSINAYTVLAGTGIPLWIDKTDDNGTFRLRFNGTGSTSEKVYPGDELLYLRCERMFVQGQNFKFWNFSDNIWDTSKLHANESDILEVYFELDTSKNILDMYVLASGGYNSSGDTKKPDIWPSDFWKSDFANYTVYVSRASWKLNNIKSGFTWN